MATAMDLFAFAALALTMLQDVVDRSVPPASQSVYASLLVDRRCNGAGVRGTTPMIRQELVHPAEAFWAQAPAKPLAERVRELMPGLSPSILAAFANAQRKSVMNDGVAMALRATSVAGSEVDELSSKYTDAF